MLSCASSSRLLSVSISVISVFTLDAAQGNPVSTQTVEELCSELGVVLEQEEKDDYRRLLAVFLDASEALMAMEGKRDVGCK